MKILTLMIPALFLFGSCKKECPKAEAPKCPKVKKTVCPKCKPCPKVAVAPVKKADPAKKYHAPKGKRAEHLPVTLPCINRSVLKFVDKKVIPKDVAKKFSKLHQKMHDQGMEKLEEQIYGLQKKMALAVANDTWKEAEIKTQLKQMQEWRLKAYMLKAKLVRDLLKDLKKEAKSKYVKELTKRITKIYKAAMEH